MALCMRYGTTVKLYQRFIFAVVGSHVSGPGKVRSLWEAELSVEDKNGKNMTGDNGGWFRCAMSSRLAHWLWSSDCDLRFSIEKKSFFNDWVRGFLNVSAMKCHAAMANYRT